MAIFNTHIEDRKYIAQILHIMYSCFHSGTTDSPLQMEERACKFFNGIRFSTDCETIPQQIKSCGLFFTMHMILGRYPENYKFKPLFVKIAETVTQEICIGDKMVKVDVTAEGNTFTSKVVGVRPKVTAEKAMEAAQRAAWRDAIDAADCPITAAREAAPEFVFLRGNVRFNDFANAANGYRTASYNTNSKKHVISGSGFDTVMFHSSDGETSIGVKFKNRICYSNGILAKMLAAYNHGVRVGGGRNTKHLVAFLEGNNIPYVTVNY